MITKPGIYKDIDINDYHTSPGISSSGISLLLDCPKKYWYEYLSGESKKESEKSRRIGSATHTLLLEPEKFQNQFAVIKSLQTKEGKLTKEKEKANNKIVITEDEFNTALACSNSIKSENIWQRLPVGNVETSLAWVDEDVLLRSRPDYYNEELRLIVDIKTTQNASAKAFQNSIYNYGYHRQAALACDGLTKLTGQQFSSVLLIVVETCAPYLVGCYLLDQVSLDVGRFEYKRAIKIYRECTEKNQWPGYSEKIEPINIPDWVFKQQEYL